MIINPYAFVAASSPETPLPSGLSIWARYKASHQSEAADTAVVSLIDSSGNARHGTQSTANQRAIKRVGVTGLGGINTTALEFNCTSSGTNPHNYTLPSMVGLTVGEIWVLTKRIPTGLMVSGNGHRVWAQLGSAADGYYPYSGNGLIYETFGRSSRLDSISSSATVTDWHTYSVASFNGTNGTVLRQNNTVIHTANNSQGWPSTPRIGGLPGNVYSAPNHYIAEIIILSALTDSGQRSGLQDYFETEYGF